jgi:outer membrane lipoprotein
MKVIAERVVIVAGLLALSACAPTSVVPPDLAKQVDWTVTFAQVKEAPQTYRGRLILVAGVVLSAKLLKEGTRLEILQLPLDSSQAPVTDLRASEGRVLATQKTFLDPATLPPGTRVTLVGEVTGSLTLPLDETEFTYPTLDVRSLTVWPKAMIAPTIGPYPYFGAYWGSYGGPYPIPRPRQP